MPLTGLPDRLPAQKLVDKLTTIVTGVFGTGSLDLGHIAPFSVTAFANGTKVLVLGDYNGNALNAEIWDIETNVWTQIAGPATGSVPANIDGHVGVLLTNGNVLIAGGENWDAAMPGTYLFNGTTFTPTGNPASRHTEGAGVLLANGKVLLLGGYTNYNNTAGLADCDLYDPALGTWAATGSLNTPTMLKPRALLLADGRVLALYGTTAETYDAGTGLWTVQPNVPISVDQYVGVTLMPSGNVFVTDGYSAYAYAPGTNTWSTLTAPSPGINNTRATVRIGTNIFIPEGGALSWLYDPILDSWSAGPVGILPSPYYVVSLSTALALYVQNNDLDTQMYGSLTLTPQIRVDASANTTVVLGRASDGETGVVIRNRSDLATGVVLDVQNQGLSQLKVEAIAANETRTSLRELEVGLNATVLGSMTAANIIASVPDQHFRDFSTITDNLTATQPDFVTTGAPGSTGAATLSDAGIAQTPTGGVVAWSVGNFDTIMHWEPGDVSWNSYNGPGFFTGTTLPALALRNDDINMLLVGGTENNAPFNARTGAWFYDIVARTVTAVADPITARKNPAAIKLPSTGGFDILLVGNGTACERFNGTSWSATGALPFTATVRPFLFNVTQGGVAKVLCLHDNHASLYTPTAGTWATAETGTFTGAEKFISGQLTAGGHLLAFRRSDDLTSVKAQYWSKAFNFWYEVDKPAGYQTGDVLAYYGPASKPLVIDSDTLQSWLYTESGVPSSSTFTQGPDIVFPLVGSFPPSIVQRPAWALGVAGNTKVLVYGTEHSRFVQETTFNPQTRLDLHEANSLTVRGRPGHSDLLRLKTYGAGNPAVRADYAGRLAFSYTDNGGVSDPQANSVTGRCAFQPFNSPADRVKVRNNLVTDKSIIFPVLETVNDATLTGIKGVIVENGAFTIVGNAATTSATFVRWFLINGPLSF